MPITAADARHLDAQDPLAAYRERFVRAEDDLIYLDGNSLGRLPQATLSKADTLLQEQWGKRLIRSWNEGWFEAPQRVGAKIASLIGAQADEVIVADSTSINLFKLVVAALKQQQGRTQLLTDDLNFPSDLYVMNSATQLLDKGHKLEVVASTDEIHGPVATLKAKLSEQTALLSLSHTVFKSGYLYDMAELNRAAQAVGALTLWDLSHSVGSVSVDLNGSGADLAVGCTYKYLNGGPGAPAFIYVRRDLQAKLDNPLAGWMGQKNLFDFAQTYTPSSGMQKFLTGTPTVASLELMEPGVAMLLDAGMPALRAKSIQQTEFLIALWEEQLEPRGFSLKSPRDAAQRGSHVSLGHPQGIGIDLAMIHAKQVIPDFRPPDNLRLGIAPLYTSYGDIFEAVARMVDIVDTRLYEHYADSTPTVT